MRHLGTCFTCFLFACVALGCGARTASLDESDFTGSDDGGGIDAVVLHDARLDAPVTPDVFTDVVPKKDTAPLPDTPPVDTGSTATTGDPCKTDAQCDKDGTGSHKCTIDLSPGYGNFDPTPVCVQLGCDPGDGTSVVPCDGDRGVCLNGGSTGLCLPACTFDASGAPAKGCAGGDACNVYTLTSATEGIGYCFGGCTAPGSSAPTSCVGGNSCQIETGYCVEKPVKYAKAIGDACTSSDAMANRCNCLYPTTTNKGYCSEFCRVGTTKCDAGFVCTAFLPASFGKSPKDIGGWCAKPCTTDGDCTGLNSTCQDSSDGKVCLPFAI